MNETLTDLDETLAVAESDGQTMALLCEAESGEWKTSPTDGLGVAKMQGAPPKAMMRLRNKAQEAMQRNGVEGSAEVNDGKLIIKIAKR